MKITGLSQKEAKERLKKYGPNLISEKKSVSPLLLILRQFKNNYLIYLLSIAALLSFLVGKSVTAWTILTVVFLVFITAFIQEYRAEKAVLALKNMILPFSLVVRGGKETRISSADIVPGDIIILRTGERVPADGRVLKENELRVDEAILTGESQEVKKTALEKNGSDPEGKIFMGTFVVSGKCQVEVTHTGMSTEFGKIARMISRTEKAMPLQIKINKIVKRMSFIAIVAGLLTGVLLIYRQPILDYPALIEIAVVVIAIIVSAFPEGFPVVLTSTLASGAYRMAKENAILNRMSTIETLGETTIICSDKTGTITAGEMTVKEIFWGGKSYLVEGAGYNKEGKVLSGKGDLESEIVNDENFRLFIKAGVVCNDSKIEKEEADQSYKINGSPTEAAILVLASKVNIENLIICNGSNVFPLTIGKTKLDAKDYTYLKRFLDVTKSNLFFAKGIILVEGWAEEILIPAIANKIGYDLTKKEVSIVNVGSTAYLHFAKIFIRNEEPILNIPVSIVTDLDNRPEKNGSFDPEIAMRKEQEIKENIGDISGGKIKLCLAKEWTLEWCLYKSSTLSKIFKDSVSEIHSGTEEFKIDSDSGDYKEIFGSKLIEKLDKRTGSPLDKVQIANVLSEKISKSSDIKFIQDDEHRDQDQRTRHHVHQQQIHIQGVFPMKIPPGKGVSCHGSDQQ